MSSAAITRRLYAARPGPRNVLGLVVAALVFAGSLALLSHGGITPARPGTEDLDLVGVLLAACSTVPIIFWRRFPFGVFVVTAGAGVLLAALGYSIDLALGPAAALYLLAAGREPETRWTARTTATVVGLLVAYLGATGAVQATFPGGELLHTGLAWSVAWFAGERTRLRREQVVDFRERARRAEREAEGQSLLAVAEERARIARDLHDSAGHAISLIAVRAGAARLRHHQDPSRSLLALEAVEELARRTADEIDQIVATLRDDSTDEDVAAPHGLASLATLIRHHAAAGLDAAVATTGVPQPLGAAADQAAYRILQEGLTNAARHGTGRARVALAFGVEEVELTVTNPVAADRASPVRGGLGLIGMRERATILGGSLDAGRAAGEFRVHARIPYGDFS